jgi:hypothetical protein
MEPWVQILITIGGVFGASHVWKYLEVRLKSANKWRREEMANSDAAQFRNDLKNRVTNLEKLLVHAGEKEDLLTEKILFLTAEVTALRVSVEYLEKENEKLREHESNQ